MLVLLLLSTIEINLHCNKDTFLLGEDILVRWEIVNTGDRAKYIEKGLSADKFLNDCKIWDSQGREVPVVGFSGSRTTSRIPRQKVEPGDTIQGVRKSGLLGEDMNMIGFVGGQHFTRAIYTSYLKPGAYHYTLFYWYGDNMDRKLWSDTLHFTVVEPTGKEREAWDLFKEFRTYSKSDLDIMVDYTIEMLKKYEQSDYISSAFRYLSLSLKSIARGRHKQLSNKKLAKIEEISTYLRENIESYSNSEYRLKGAIVCLFKSMRIHGSSKEAAKEEIRALIEQKEIPTDKRIRRFLNIK